MKFCTLRFEGKVLYPGCLVPATASGYPLDPIGAALAVLRFRHASAVYSQHLYERLTRKHTFRQAVAPIPVSHERFVQEFKV